MARRAIADVARQPNAQSSKITGRRLIPLKSTEDALWFDAVD